MAERPEVDVSLGALGTSGSNGGGQSEPGVMLHTKQNHRFNPIGGRRLARHRTAPECPSSPREVVSRHYPPDGKENASPILRPIPPSFSFNSVPRVRPPVLSPSALGFGAMSLRSPTPTALKPLSEAMELESNGSTDDFDVRGLPREVEETSRPCTALDQLLGSTDARGSPRLMLPPFKACECVSADTVAELIMTAEGHGGVVDVIDCRFPYEYDHGHIRGARNVWTRDVLASLITDEELPPTSTPRILIFHCEFSTERGPDLCQHLRNLDRKANYHRYPYLQYPDVYLLQGGYREFYQSYSHLCVPQNYLSMFDPAFKAERSACKRFRAESMSRSHSCSDLSQRLAGFTRSPTISPTTSPQQTRKPFPRVVPRSHSSLHDLYDSAPTSILRINFRPISPRVEISELEEHAAADALQLGPVAVMPVVPEEDGFVPPHVMDADVAEP